MSGNSHDCLIAGLRLGKLCDGVVSEVMEPESGAGAVQLVNVGLALSADLTRSLQVSF